MKTPSALLLSAAAAVSLFTLIPALAQQAGVEASGRSPVLKTDCVRAAAKNNRVPEKYLLAIELATDVPGTKQYSCADYEVDAKRLAQSLARTKGDFARAAAHFNGGESGLRKYDAMHSTH